MRAMHNHACKRGTNFCHFVHKRGNMVSIVSWIDVRVEQDEWL